MKNTAKIFIIVLLIMLENIILLYIVNIYNKNNEYKETLKSNKGLTQSCENLNISEDLLSVLEKMEGFDYQMNISEEKIYIYFGDEWSDNAGTALLFDKNYNLTHKSCNASWEPNTPSL